MSTRKRPTRAGVEAARSAYPTSFAQERLWFLDQMSPGNPFYNLPLAIRLAAPVNVGALERALNECVRRHEILRTTFEVVEGQPRQVIAPSLHVACPVVDLRHLDHAARERKVLRLAAEDAARPFDLRVAPLMRASVLRLGIRDHVLLLSLHHIISDDWSLEILWRELAACYAAFLAGRGSPLPPLRIQYLDYAVWQREWLQGDVLAGQLAYWTRELAGLPRLDLHTDRPRPAVASFRGAYEPVAIGRPLAERLKALGRTANCTLFMTLLAAYQVLLARYAGQHDVAVGVPITNRTRPELEALIGFFVNTLVMRADLAGNPRFVEFLGQVRGRATGAYAHQDLPFERLVQELQPERDLSRNPLVQVTIQLQQPRGATAASRSIGARPLDVARRTAIFDLALRLWESPEGLRGGVEYSTDLFDRETIRRLMGSFQTLLEAITVDPAARIADLPLMTDAERRQIIAAWQVAVPVAQTGSLVHRLFRRQAEQSPDAPAVICAGNVTTYRQLRAQVSTLAARLRADGVSRDTLVGIALERSVDLVAAMLAVLEAGGAYVPLEPAYPRERLATMARNSGLSTLITTQALVGQLPVEQVRVLLLDAPWKNTAEPASPAPHDVGPDNLAYVIYTSGSSGTPKGVAITHGGLANHMRWMQSQCPLVPGDRVLQKTPISFDASVWEFYAPLLAGATLVMARPERHVDGAFLVGELLEHDVSVVQLVPSLLKLCLAEPRFRECRSLRRVFCGGEPLTPDLVERFHDAGLDAELHNLYGPTEATIDAITGTCPRDGVHRIAIGRPIDGMSAYVLDEGGRPVPIGVAGELYVAGAGLARGYLHAPDLTAERFVPDPFSSNPGARMYRTGDRAVFNAAGKFEYLGRLDTQVKVRGMRVELGDVEAALRQHPNVRDAAAMVREDTPGDTRLVGYIVPRTDRPPASDELRRFLAARVPEQMIPSAWATLARLPLGPNGKLARDQLSAPAAAAERVKEYVAPRTPVEERLAAIWSQTLRVRRVGVHDNFFELGGHSLLATQLVARVRQAFHIDLPLRHVFHAPTPAGLAAVVESIIIEEVAVMSDAETERLVGTGGPHV